MSKHTPEPWNYNDDMQFSKLHEGAIILKREDAIRAFKCVNACAGMEEPAIEIPALNAEVERLRDALSKAHDVIAKGGKQ
jgi:hypothetical protein